jgi:drug/metabolite transporter (DMT)-like permease
MNSQEMVDAEAAMGSRKAVASAGGTTHAELLAAVSIVLGATAQLILKGALLMWNAHSVHSRPAWDILEPAVGVLFGLGVYATGTLFWWKAVSRASISYLYPLSAASYGLVALGGRYFLAESIQMGRWVGIGVITLGVAMMALSNMRRSA